MDCCLARVPTFGSVICTKSDLSKLSKYPQGLEKSATTKTSDLFSLAQCLCCVLLANAHFAMRVASIFSKQRHTNRLSACDSKGTWKGLPGPFWGTGRSCQTSSLSSTFHTNFPSFSPNKLRLKISDFWILTQISQLFNFWYPANLTRRFQIASSNLTRRFQISSWMQVLSTWTTWVSARFTGRFQVFNDESSNLCEDITLAKFNFQVSAQAWKLKLQIRGFCCLSCKDNNKCPPQKRHYAIEKLSFVASLSGSVLAGEGLFQHMLKSLTNNMTMSLLYSDLFNNIWELMAVIWRQKRPRKRSKRPPKASLAVLCDIISLYWSAIHNKHTKISLIVPRSTYRHEKANQGITATVSENESVCFLQRTEVRWGECTQKAQEDLLKVSKIFVFLQFVQKCC